MKLTKYLLRSLLLYCLLLSLHGCSWQPSEVPDYTNAMMDFSAVRTVAVLPFLNLTNDDYASARMRDAFMGMLLATETVYVLPPGEVDRGIGRANLRIPQAPSVDEVIQLKGLLQVDAVITGVLREYGPVRSGAAEANIVSLSLQMIETQNGTTVWTGSSTKGGITLADQMLGRGGRPMNDVTIKVINDLLDQLFE